MLLVVLPIVLVLPASVARAAFGSAARFASPTAVVGAIHALRPSVFATHARSTQAASGVLDKRDERVSCFLSGDETYLSGVVSAGGKWFAASPRGLFTSTDGRTFVLSTQSMPLAPHGIGATTDSVWVWSKSEFRRGATKSVTRFPMAAGAAPVVLETPVFVDSVICLNDTAYILGSKAQGKGSPFFLVWTKDNGVTWSELALPIRRIEDGPALAHGPQGFLVVGNNEQGQATLAQIRDLKTVVSEVLSMPRDFGRTPQFRAIAAVGSRVAILGGTPRTEANSAGDFLLTRSPYITAPDGSVLRYEWECRAVPLAPYSKKQPKGRSTLFTNDGVAVLATETENGATFFATRDLENWIEVLLLGTTSFTEWGTLSPCPQQQVLFLTGVPYPGNSHKSSFLVRVPLPTPEESANLVPHRFFRSEFSARDRVDDWEWAFVDWDAAMSLGDLEKNGGMDARVQATKRALERWRYFNSGRPTDQDVVMATNMFIRLLGRARAERMLQAVVDLSEILSEKDANGVSKGDGLARVCARVRSEKIGQLADLLEDIAAARKGAPRKFLKIETLMTEPEPQRGPAEFDVEVARSRALRGSAGAARDLMRAYFRGEGVPLDPAAGEFWAFEATRLGLEIRQGKEDLVKSADAGSVTALLDLAREIGGIDSKEYDLEYDLDQVRALLQRAADQGSSLAMSFLADSLIADTGTNTDLRDALVLSERAARAGNPFGMRSLGVAYSSGSGVARNQRIATEYFSQAALREDFPSMLECAARYAYGIGCEKSESTMDFWLGQIKTYQDRRAAWDKSERVDVVAMRQTLIDESYELSDQLYSPPRIQEPHVDLKATRTAARAGDPVACSDLSTAYLHGLGVYPNYTAAERWKRRAVALGWDDKTDTDPKSGRRSMPMYVSTPEVVEGDYLAYLKAGAEAGGVRFKRELGTRLLADADAMELSAAGADRNESDANTAKLRARMMREVGVSHLRVAAELGSGEAWVQLGLLAMHPATSGLVQRSEIECFEAAGEQHLPRGFAVAGMAILQDVLLQDANLENALRVRAVTNLLRAARVPEPAQIDRATQPEAFLEAAERALAKAAVPGDPDAMVAFALMLAFDMPHRARDIEYSELWAYASREMGGDLIAIPGFKGLPGWNSGNSDELAELRALPFAAQIKAARDRESRDPRVARRVDRIHPGASRWEQAYRALLEQSLDDATIKAAVRSMEVFSPRYSYMLEKTDFEGALQQLRTRAAQKTEARGLQLIALIAGLSPSAIASVADAEAAFEQAASAQDPDAPRGRITLSPMELAIVQHLGVTEPEEMGEESDIALRERVVKLMAARAYYGLGTERDSARAALILSTSWERSTVDDDVAAVLLDVADEDLKVLAREWKSRWK